MSERPLVKYSAPPVIETILGVQFDPVPGLTSAHLGAFWQTLGSDWPWVTDAPTLPPQLERFSNESPWAQFGVQLMLGASAGVRLQITNAVKDRMIQLQNGQFFFNWLGSAGSPYPQYLEVRRGFEQRLVAFREFLIEKGLGPIKLNQWEVVYQNQIPRGGLWKAPSEWNFCTLLGDPALPADLDGLESFSGEWHFALPATKGRLHIRWQHLREGQSDAGEMVILNLIARGAVANDDELIAGLDLGRAAIVHSFTKFMSDQANAAWGIQDVNG
ncbi:MAG TPA: TIGR04255 family protein [Pirellulales bacterium]